MHYGNSRQQIGKRHGIGRRRHERNRQRSGIRQFWGTAEKKRCPGFCVYWDAVGNGNARAALSERPLVLLVAGLFGIVFVQVGVDKMGCGLRGLRGLPGFRNVLRGGAIMGGKNQDQDGKDGKG